MQVLKFKQRLKHRKRHRNKKIAIKNRVPIDWRPPIVDTKNGSAIEKLIPLWANKTKELLSPSWKEKPLSL